jgi:hypothetical protein
VSSSSKEIYNKLKQSTGFEELLILPVQASPLAYPTIWIPFDVPTPWRAFAHLQLDVDQGGDFKIFPVQRKISHHSETSGPLDCPAFQLAMLDDCTC